MGSSERHCDSAKPTGMHKVVSAATDEEAARMATIAAEEVAEGKAQLAKGKGEAASREDPSCEKLPLSERLPPHVVERARTVFDSLDVNQDDYIEMSELEGYFLTHGLVVTPKFITSVYEAANTDTSDPLNFEEFLQFFHERHKDIRKVFTRLEQHCEEQEVTASAMAKAAHALGYQVSLRSIERMMNVMDRNQDGMLTYAEFEDFLLLLPVRDLDALFEAFSISTSLEQPCVEWSIRQHFPSNDQVITEESIETKLLAGGLAGAISRTATAPIDRVRIIMQSAKVEQPFRDVFRNILQKEGYRGLFRGNAINCAKIAPETATRYALFDFLKARTADNPESVTVLERFAAGGLAGAVAQALIYPFDIARTRISLSTEYKGFFDCVTSVARSEGIGALYKGLGVSTFGIVPYAGIDLAVNSILRDTAVKYYKAREEKPGVFTLLGCGMASGTTALVATYPIGLVRTKLQASGMENAERYHGVMDCIRRTFSAQGLGGFYRGLLPTIVKVVPSQGISYAAFGIISQYLQKEEGDDTSAKHTD
eukprot:m.127850 g.127850  ORF g.127850 m.127850 type:complete len:540 (+) comp13856_c0_seq9:306-1925(+)